MQFNPTAACPTCGQENKDDWVYCASCGATLSAMCSACGKQNPSDASYCVMCGTSLGERKTATSEPAEATGRLSLQMSAREIVSPCPPTVPPNY